MECYNFKKKDVVVLNSDYNKCDKYDYLVSAFSGAIGGLVDIFIVGSPLNSKGGKITDTAVDEVVEIFAKMNGWNENNDIEGAIKYLESKFVVNYDQSVENTKELIFGVTPKNHHMKSLAHSPDIVGLVFSLINQFTGTSTIVFRGKPIHYSVKKKELIGKSFGAKLVCGCVNWIGHLLSDIAGSSGAKRKGNRGVGLVAPLYELFELIDYGKFKVLNSKGQFDYKTVAELAETIYMKGYDARFAMAASIPCVISEFITAFIWALRELITKGEKARIIIRKIRKDARLRIMQIVSNATLCAMDAIDALLKSGGNIVAFFLRLNIIAWYKLILRVIKEIAIYYGIDTKLSNLAEYIKACMLAEIEDLKEELGKKYSKELALANEYIKRIEVSKKVNDINNLVVTSVLALENKSVEYIDNTADKLIPQRKVEKEKRERVEKRKRNLKKILMIIGVIVIISLLVLLILKFVPIPDWFS